MIIATRPSTRQRWTISIRWLLTKHLPTYFEQGDEPFNGMFENGDPVPAGQVIGTPAGSREAEISNFLVEDVGNGGIREQLAQQLLAFIFNTYFRAGGLDVNVALPGEGDVKA